MGIKGVYGEIGPGERVALSKLAVEHLEQTGRPFRLAIDISIWQFQIQSGKGGSNPTLRTLYYRLLRLLSLTIQPIFVFDGPNKPLFKRGKKIKAGTATLPNLMIKQMLKLFGFLHHTAPGEAEAECALLQREGIVDAVLSEDVDTLMFGCTKTLRNWSGEGAKGNHAPTHVSVYEAEANKKSKGGLDREGMILIALMSGGDYIPEGVPGCGIKVACEAARAGFGTSLCTIAHGDAEALANWRHDVSKELQTNESKFFRTKHKALSITNDFPNLEVLRYYTHPTVSSQEKIQSLRHELLWEQDVDILGLRAFVAEAFGWTHKIGAKKFVRGLAPALLVSKLRTYGDRRTSEHGDVLLTAINEMQLVRTIHSRRTHFSSGGVPELRLIFLPLEIVPLDLDAEDNNSVGYSRNEPLDDAAADIEILEAEDALRGSQSSLRGGPSHYDPTYPDRVWVPETIAKLGIPLKVQDYEESLLNPKKYLKQKAAAKKAVTNGGMPHGALDKYVKFSNPSANSEDPRPSLLLGADVQDDSLPFFSMSRTDDSTLLKSNITYRRSTRTAKAAVTNPSSGLPLSRKSNNPWELARTKRSAVSERAGVTKALFAAPEKAKIQTSAVADPKLSPSFVRKHTRSPSPLTSSSLVEPLFRYPELEPSSPSKKRISETRHEPLDKTKSLSQSLSSVDSPGREISTGLNTNRRIDFSSSGISPTSCFGPSNILPEIVTNYSAERRDELSLPEGPATDARLSIIDTCINLPCSSSEISTLSRPARNDLAQDKGNTKSKASDKKFLMLRQSLEGAWTEVDENEKLSREKRLVGKGPAKSWRLSQIEVVDLT